MLDFFAPLFIMLSLGGVVAYVISEHEKGRWDDVKKATYERDQEIDRRTALIIRESGERPWEARCQAEREYIADLKKVGGPNA